jgi:hypothetical protein
MKVSADNGFIDIKDMKKAILRIYFIDSIMMDVLKVGICRIELATHVYTNYVAVKLSKNCEHEIFNPDGKTYMASNIGLSKGALALLVIIWAKIILPKRQMQRERVSPSDEGQGQMFKESKSIPQDKDMVVLEEKALYADFSHKLGGRKFYAYLAELARADLIIRKSQQIHEGPLLDILIDYPMLAERIINGALESILKVNEGKTDNVNTEISKDADETTAEGKEDV